MRILKRKKYVYIWAKYSLEDKQNKEKRELFKEKLDEYMRITKEKPNYLQNKKNILLCINFKTTLKLNKA